MTDITFKRNNVVLAIVPSSRGFGHAVLEGNRGLVNWGVKAVAGDKNAGTLKHADKMMALYKPGMLVLHDAAGKSSKRGLRVRKLTKKLVALAAHHKISVELFSREQIREAFFIDGKGTRHTIAKLLALRFPKELGHRLPRKRRAWEGEDSRMKMFDAVALVMKFQLENRKGKGAAKDRMQGQSR